MYIKIVYLLLIFVISSVCGRVTEPRESIISNTIYDGDDDKTASDPLVPRYSVNVTETTTDFTTTTTGTPESVVPCDNPSDGSQEITDNTIDSANNEPCKLKVNANNEALILTRYIEDNRFEEARNASRVDPTLFHGLTSYSGFLTVNKTYNSNLFFWYFPVENKPVNETPWIVWLQGGPGASSMTGMFDEIGPVHVDPKNMIRRNHYTWLSNHSLVFLDNPVGTGFSFTNHEDGYAKDLPTYGRHMHIALMQLVKMFPELKTAPLYLGGESYAGKYIPALGIEIHRHKNQSGNDINFQGMMVGNGYIDPVMVSQLSLPYYNLGLISKQQFDRVAPILTSFNNHVAANRSIEAKETWMTLVSILLSLSNQNQGYNFLKDDVPVGGFTKYLTKPEVKRALHVGDIRFSLINRTVNTMLAPEFLTSAKPLFEELLDHYRVLLYCGQLDLMLSCRHLSDNYRTWKWNASQEFLNATRYPYVFENKLSGYLQSGGQLTEVVIRGAGHLAPLDKPAPVRNLVTRWTHKQPIEKSFRLSNNTPQKFVLNDFAINYI